MGRKTFYVALLLLPAARMDEKWPFICFVLEHGRSLIDEWSQSLFINDIISSAAVTRRFSLSTDVI